MALTKSKGNMYSWVTHTHTHIGGECPHKCSYCYVQAIEKRFKGGKYQGELRLNEDELKVNYGKGRIIFIEHCNDMWAAEVPDKWIAKILVHCNKYPENEYVFQTKNPGRYREIGLDKMPPKRILGCTIETDDHVVAETISKAPSPTYRAYKMAEMIYERKFITVEPILKGNMINLAKWTSDINPEFVNIGADSKGTGLDEPTADDVKLLISELNRYGIEIKQKRNLDRLLK